MELSKVTNELSSIHPLSVSTEIVYQGNIFTVAKTTLKTIKYGREITVTSEGIARRSYLDKPDPARACEIAKGRAERALYKKLVKNRNIHHHYMG